MWRRRIRSPGQPAGAFRGPGPVRRWAGAALDRQTVSPFVFEPELRCRDGWALPWPFRAGCHRGRPTPIMTAGVAGRLVSPPVFKTGEGLSGPWWVRFPHTPAKRSEARDTGIAVAPSGRRRPHAEPDTAFGTDAIGTPSLQSTGRKTPPRFRFGGGGGAGAPSGASVCPLHGHSGLNAVPFAAAQKGVRKAHSELFPWVPDHSDLPLGRRLPVTGCTGRGPMDPPDTHGVRVGR